MKILIQEDERFLFPGIPYKNFIKITQKLNNLKKDAYCKVY